MSPDDSTFVAVLDSFTLESHGYRAIGTDLCTVDVVLVRDDSIADPAALAIAILETFCALT